MLLITLDLPQACYQILLKIYLKDFITISTNCESCLHYISTKDNKLTFKCIKCIKNYQKDFHKDLTKIFKYI